MMRMFASVVIVIVLAMNSGWSADDTPTASTGCTNCRMAVTVQRRTPQTTEVSEVENSYLAPSVTILVGDTVTWTNNGMVDHTTTSDDGLWDSGRMVPGKVYSHTFKKVGTFKYNCVYHKSMGMKGTVIVLPPAPVITSSLVATGGAGLPFYYAITGTNSPDTFTAMPLPQGLTLNGNIISGIPTVSGLFSITIGASSASGGDSKTLTLDVVDAIAETDTDGDGFSDALEIAAGSSENDMSATPYSIVSGAIMPVIGSKVSIALNFTKMGSDSIKVSGLLPLATAPVLSGAIVAVDIGGVVKTFELDEKGSAKSGTSSAKFTTKTDRNAGLVSAFSVSLSKGDFAATLATIGLDGTADLKAVRKALSLTILFNGTQFQTTRVVLYTSKLNKNGMAK